MLTTGIPASPGSRRRKRLWIAAGAVAAVVVAAFVILVATGVLPGLGRRAKLDWPDQGLAIDPQSPEAAVDAVFTAIAARDFEGAAAWFGLARMGADKASVTTTLTNSLAQTGELERWLVVAKDEGPPVMVTVYCHFSRQGDLALRAEVFGQAGEWLLGNIRSQEEPSGAWHPPQWETGATDRLRLFVWPGFGSDLERLRATGEQAFDQALGPLALGPEALPPVVTEVADVFVYDSLNSVRSATGRGYPDWFAGSVWAGGVHLLASPALARNHQDLYQIFVHELNHLLVARYVAALSLSEAGEQGVAVPSWLGEGMAGLAAGQLTGQRRSSFIARVSDVTLTLPKLSQLVTGFDTNPVEGRYEYAFSLAEYLTGSYGPDTLRQVLEAVGEGSDPLRALEGVTGQTIDDFTRAWHRWLRAGMPVEDAGS